MKCHILVSLAWVLLSTEIGVHTRVIYQLDICEEVYEEEACTNGYYQELARILQQCLDPVHARRTQESCRRNEMGRYCDSFHTFFKLSNISSQDCEAALMSGSASDCSPECREFLISSRSMLGCCVTVHNSTNLLVEHVPFEYSLWSACGVEPVTEECPPSTITLPPDQNVPKCTDAFRFELLQSFQCRRQYVEPIQQTLSAAEGCQRDQLLNFMYTQDRCKVNEDGSYCGMLPQDTLYTDAVRNCQNTSTCAPLCIETLNNIADTLGCCFNERYNTTGGIDWLSYEFYSMCGLEPLGSCEIKLNDDAPFDAATAATNIMDHVGMGASKQIQSTTSITIAAAVLVTMIQILI